jgi:hypothetical protein
MNGRHVLVQPPLPQLSHNNSVALDRKRIIRIERPPLVGEVSAIFVEGRGVVWSAWRIPYGRNFAFPDRYFFLQVAPQLYSRGWVDHVPDPLLLRKSESNPGLWICMRGTFGVPASAWPSRESYEYVLSTSPFPFIFTAQCFINYT